MQDMRDMRVLKCIGYDGEYRPDLIGCITLACDKLIEDGAALYVFDGIITVILLFFRVRDDAKIL